MPCMRLYSCCILPTDIPSIHDDLGVQHSTLFTRDGCRVGMVQAWIITWLRASRSAGSSHVFPLYLTNHIPPFHDDS